MDGFRPKLYVLQHPFDCRELFWWAINFRIARCKLKEAKCKSTWERKSMECGRGCWRVKRRWDWQENFTEGDPGNVLVRYFRRDFSTEVCRCRRTAILEMRTELWMLFHFSYPEAIPGNWPLFNEKLCCTRSIAWVIGLNTLRMGHKLRAFSWAIKRNKHLSQNCVFETLHVLCADSRRWTLDFVHLHFENDIFWRKKREAWVKLEGGLNKL